MKKGLIGVILFCIILIIFFSIYSIFKNTMPDPTDCSKAGEAYSNPSLGPEEIFTEKCCEGLVPISRDLRYIPDHEFADENGCVLTEGGGSICSDCGNGICEEGWENKCNCPEDCL